MKRQKLLCLALLLPPFLQACDDQNRRSAIPYSAQSLAPSTTFEPSQSAGFFVGISKFSLDDSLQDVTYAADDAVDLAYAFTMSANAALVLPRNVVIALSGNPRKSESQKRLSELRAAGATVVRKADQANLIDLLQKQSALAGRNGILIIFFATHGFSEEGVPYLLGESSFFRHRETTLSAAKIADIAASSDAVRSLIFIDACRERVSAGSRSVEPLSAAPLIESMARVAGQVIFYAAAHGGYAYDDPKRGNGVFTAAVIDSLQCKTTSKTKLVTVDELARRVEHRVRGWIRKNRDPLIQKATQISTEGSTESMPLELCRGTAPPARGALSRVTVNGSVLYAFDGDGNTLWQRDTGAPIRQAILGKRYRGEAPPIAVLTNDVLTYDHSGKLLSTYRHNGPIDRIAIAQRTGRHAPKLIVAGSNVGLGRKLRTRGPVPTVFMFDPRKVDAGEELWYGAILPASHQIEDLHFETDKISVTTSKETVIHLDFDGRFLSTEQDPAETTRFTLVPTP